MASPASSDLELLRIARELYASPPAKFVAARNAKAKSLEGELARAVRALIKPSPSAWAVNRLIAEQAKDVAAAIAVGADLQNAQTAGDRAETDRLNRLRRELVRGLVDEAAAIGEREAVHLSAAGLEEVNGTITAALADDDAAAAVRSGLLIRALRSSGLERVDVDGAVAIGGTVSAGSRRKKSPTATAARDAEIRRKERARAAEEKAAAMKLRDDLRRARAERTKRLRLMKSELAEIESARSRKLAELAKTEAEVSRIEAQLDSLE